MTFMFVGAEETDAGAILSPPPSGNAWRTIVVALSAMLAMSLQNVGTS